MGLRGGGVIHLIDKTMNWENLFTEKRYGTDTIIQDGRSEYHRDFDRLIFNSGFRRLQNKTQVFPLPGPVFVHNRLTHSLEVASVGRSIGKLVGQKIVKINRLSDKAKIFYKYELSNVIAAACLAHDIGNPPFSHSGEKAIAKYFLDNFDTKIEGTQRLKSYFSPHEEWIDLINFEGNANGFRYLTHKFYNKVPGGLRLTYTTLAATLKYPCESVAAVPDDRNTKKFNFFYADKHTFLDVCQSTGMEQIKESPLSYKRHPFVYLTEIADDISNVLIDLEDAHRLGIDIKQDYHELFLKLFTCMVKRRIVDYDLKKFRVSYSEIKNENDRLAYLRLKCINILSIFAAEIFETHIDKIINGQFEKTIMSQIESDCTEIRDMKKLIKETLYNHQSVLKIEIVGYQVISQLLNLFIPAFLKKEPDPRDEKIRSLLPKQYRVEDYDQSDYQRVLAVLDFVSGMTDTYALQLFKELFGMEIPKHQI